MDFCLDLIGRNWEGWETVLLFFKFYNKKAREKLSSSQFPLSVTSREHFRLEAQLVQRLRSKCVPAIFPGPTAVLGHGEHSPDTRWMNERDEVRT